MRAGRCGAHGVASRADHGAPRSLRCRLLETLGARPSPEQSAELLGTLRACFPDLVSHLSLRMAGAAGDAAPPGGRRCLVRCTPAPPPAPQVSTRPSMTRWPSRSRRRRRGRGGWESRPPRAARRSERRRDTQASAGRLPWR